MASLTTTRVGKKHRGNTFGDGFQHWTFFQSVVVRWLVGKVRWCRFISRSSQNIALARDFFELFWCIGEVVEHSITHRKNKIGKKFGFARFKEVVDMRLLAVKLDNIIVDGKKIHANLPRFERFGNSVSANCSKKGSHYGFRHQGGRKSNGARSGYIFNSRKGGKTFDNVLNKKEEVINEVVCGLHVSSKEVDINRFSKAKVGLSLSIGHLIVCNLFWIWRDSLILKCQRWVQISLFLKKTKTVL